jgi:hypothetical protein
MGWVFAPAEDPPAAWSPDPAWLLEGSSSGRLVYVQRDLTVIRPARHVWKYGRLVARTPTPAAAVPATATYHADEIRAATTKTPTSGPVGVFVCPGGRLRRRRDSNS